MNVGDVVGSYRITRVIGEGGMGVVYLGTHTLIGREAAIKVLLPSLSNKQEAVQRFFNEAKATSSIKHPGIVEIYDFGYSEQGHAFIVMEHLEGETLDARIQRLGNIPAIAALPALAQVARALGAAHDVGVVHRDLKPENIYVVSDPEVTGGERTKILDFGIAKLRNAGNVGVRTASGQVMGPPGYMAPEQCLGAAEVDPRADIYALGCILFDMLCGRPPFESANFADVLAAHVSREPPAPSSLVPSISRAVDALVADLLQKAPESRPQTVADVLARIDAVMRELAGNAAPRRPAASKPPPIPPSARPKRPSKRPSSVEVAPELLDSRVPLPPLPRPNEPAASPPPPPRNRPAPRSSPPPPPPPRATAHAATLYESEQPPARPVKDPALAATMAAPISPPQPQPPRPAFGPSGTLMAPHGRPPMQPQPQPQQPPLRPQPEPPPMSDTVGPHGTFALSPGDTLPPMDPPGPAGVVFPQDPVMAQRPMQPAPAQMAAIDPRPRPMPQPSRAAGVMLPIVLILIIGAAGGGFFLYRQMTSSPSASPAVDAAAAVAVADKPGPDAAPVQAVDARPSPAVDAAATVAAVDAGSTPADAGVAVAASADAAASKPPPVERGSGQVIDPALGPGVPTVTLKISSRPSGAKVIRTYDSLQLGKTPLEYVTKKFNANEEFLVQLDGHYPVKTTISTNRDGARQVVLLARPKK